MKRSGEVVPPGFILGFAAQNPDRPPDGGSPPGELRAIYKTDFDFAEPIGLAAVSAAAKDIGAMVSYAFLGHRGDSGSYASDDSRSGVIRREAFVEHMLDYLLRTDDGDKVLLQAVRDEDEECGLPSEQLELDQHTRQARSGTAIPDFELLYRNIVGGEAPTILLELKVGAVISPDQELKYPQRLAALARSNPDGKCYLVSLSPTWAPTHFPDPSMPDEKTAVRSISFKDLTNAARAVYSEDSGPVHRWEALEAIAESLGSKVPPLGGLAVLDDAAVTEEMVAWLSLFDRLASSLTMSQMATGGRPTSQVGFGNKVDPWHYYIAFDAANERYGWRLDFGEAAARVKPLDKGKSSHRNLSPIWLFRQSSDPKKWEWEPTMIGLHAPDALAGVEERLALARTGEDTEGPVDFIGTPVTRSFETARAILWAAMRESIEQARRESGAALHSARYRGIEIDRTGTRTHVVAMEIDSAQAPGVMRISVDGKIVDTIGIERGDEYVVRVATAVRLAMDAAPTQPTSR
jgi:hypothetical protein